MRIGSIYSDVQYVYIIHSWCVSHIVTFAVSACKIISESAHTILLNQQLIWIPYTFESYHVLACYLLTYHVVCDSILCGYFDEWHSSQQLHGS